MPENAILNDLLNRHISDLAGLEALDEDTIRQAVAQGTMVLLANPAHKNVAPILVGQPATIKVNANLGTSPLIEDPAKELKKVDLARAAGAHTIMDLSTGGDLDAIRQSILEACPLPLGTVPLYAAAQKRVRAGAHPATFTADGLFEEIEAQAEQGVDFMTVHCGVTLRSAELAEKAERVMGVVSRGGSITARYMRDTGKENPLYEQYDRLLDIAKRHNVTLSLGDGMRPGAGCDAGDTAQWEEVVTLAELTRRAWDAGVQVMIEGPGHVPMNLVQAQIQGIKQLCMGAPLYVLGPLVTDCAPGYDHIVGAIGGAIAASSGADFLCYLTPAEHLTLPDGKDVFAGVMASRIAAQAAENAMGRPLARQRDMAMNKARAELNWDKMAKVALDPSALHERRKEHKDLKECAMCGEFCAVKMLKDL